MNLSPESKKDIIREIKMLEEDDDLNANYFLKKMN